MEKAPHFWKGKREATKRMKTWLCDDHTDQKKGGLLKGLMVLAFYNLVALKAELHLDGRGERHFREEALLEL